MSKQGTCNCSKGWMGEACESPCIHGKPTSDYICQCDPCYNGVDCLTLCSNRSNICTEGKCSCGIDGWRGEFCERRGCPGIDVDCSGHGTCFADTQTCTCETGWKGNSRTVRISKFCNLKHGIDCFFSTKKRINYQTHGENPSSIYF